MKLFQMVMLTIALTIGSFGLIGCGDCNPLDKTCCINCGSCDGCNCENCNCENGECNE